MNQQDREHVRAAMAFLAASGFADDTLLDELDARIDDLVEGADAAFRKDIQRQVVEGLARQRDREATWTEETVNDRIDEAFDELWDEGIVALQNVGYSPEEGWEDVRDAAELLDEPRGAVFWHGGETERAVDGAGLNLTFGALGPDDDEGHAAIGREVLEVLRKHGVEASWSGTVGDPVVIAPFAWQKRAYTDPP